MAQTNFNVGAIANDGTGEPLRQAFQEQQAMNTELYTTKVDKVVGKELSSNDFTDANVIKLGGIEAGAEVNVQPDWEQSDNTADDYIKNKPTELFSSVGYFHYTDTATQTTPLTILPDTNKKLTNDGLGAQTNLTQAPYGVSTLFNTTTNEFDFSQLAIGDVLDMRVDLLLTTTAANQHYLVFLRVGEGSDAEYDLPITNGHIKTASSDNRIVGNEPFSIDYQQHIDNPATLYIISDDDGSVKVNGWYAAIVRKSVNIINVKNNRQVKLINGTSPYTLLQGDSIKFLVLQSEYDVVLPLELEDFTEFWIKNASGSGREVTFDTDVVFVGSPLIPDNGLCVLKKLYSSGIVETWSVNVVSESGGNFIPLSGTEVGAPITGDLEISGSVDDGIGLTNTNGGAFTRFGFKDGGGFYSQTEQGPEIGGIVSTSLGLVVLASDSSAFGIKGSSDFTPNITELDYTQKIYVDENDLQNASDTVTGVEVNGDLKINFNSSPNEITFENLSGIYPGIFFNGGQYAFLKDVGVGLNFNAPSGEKLQFRIGNDISEQMTYNENKRLQVGYLYNQTDTGERLQVNGVVKADNFIRKDSLQTVASSTTVTPTSTNDIVTITAQATGLTLANPTGTFAEGQALMIRIKDNGTARSITFGSNYRAIGITLPTTTVISKILYLGVIYNSTDAKFDVLGINQQA